MRVWPDCAVVHPQAQLEPGTLFAFVRPDGSPALGFVVSKAINGGAEKRSILLADPSRCDNDEPSFESEQLFLNSNRLVLADAEIELSTRLSHFQLPTYSPGAVIVTPTGEKLLRIRYMQSGAFVDLKNGEFREQAEVAFQVNGWRIVLRHPSGDVRVIHSHRFETA